jgi:hypothetical protein
VLKTALRILDCPSTSTDIASHRQELSRCLDEALHRCQSPLVIRHAWRNTGLQPFCPDIVLKDLPEKREGTESFISSLEKRRNKIDSKLLTSVETIAEFLTPESPAESQKEMEEEAEPLVDFQGIVEEEDQNLRRSQRLKEKATRRSSADERVQVDENDKMPFTHLARRPMVTDRRRPSPVFDPSASPFPKRPKRKYVPI